MDIKEYISSGIIESYVLGFTTEKENEELWQLANQYPEIQQEIDENRKAIERYATAFSLTAPTELKERIFDEIDDHKETQVFDIQENKPNSVYWIAASLLLISSSLLLNVFLFQNLQKSEGKLADLISQNQKLASENIINSARYKEADKRLALFNKPGNKTIKLSGLPIAPHASVLVQWNSVSGDLFISGNNLPALPSGKQYQLWAIIDGKPVDAGIVSLDAEINGIYEMNKISKAQAFAVSLEKEGGSLVPTMEAIYVMGSI